MTIVHIVLFQIEADADASKVTDFCQRMLALKSDCIHPTTQRPYVKSVIGGKDNSLDDRTAGLTHGFVVEFENEEDRKYYIEKDPAHAAFKASLTGVVQKVTVVDFAPGEF
ncbi:MAG: hypothetical protein M1833_004135 [Piccolia ochrophora]|nr:MAG: hypothetical protein M1833_004135 [Piccolia ochrophora]